MPIVTKERLPMAPRQKPTGMGDIQWRGAGLSSRLALYGDEGADAQASVKTPKLGDVVTTPVPAFFTFMDRVRVVYYGLRDFKPRPEGAAGLTTRIERLVQDLQSKQWMDAGGIVAPRSLMVALQQTTDDAEVVWRSAMGRVKAAARVESDAQEDALQETISKMTGGVMKGPKVPEGVMSSRAAVAAIVQHRRSRGGMESDLPVATPNQDAGRVTVLGELPESAPVVAQPGAVAPPTPPASSALKWLAAGVLALLVL